MATSIQSGIELWELIRQGDRNAFDNVYHQYVSQLFTLAYKHIPNRTDAEDIVQEVFLNIWEKRREIIIHSSLFNYLYSTTRYKILRFIKDNHTRPESLELFQELLQQYSLPDAWAFNDNEYMSQSSEDAMFMPQAGEKGRVCSYFITPGSVDLRVVRLFRQPK